SPCFDMSVFGANPTLKFYTKYRSPSWQDNLAVEYSDNGVNWFIAGAQLSGNFGFYSQRSYTINLSNLTDLENVKIRFAVRTNESSVDEGWAIDNIELDGPSGNVGVASIENPSSGCGNTGTTSITVKVANTGGATQSNVPISYTINGANAVNETVSQIPARDTISFTFNTTFTAVLGSSYSIKAYTKLLGDSDANDDTSAVEIESNTSVSSFPYQANFESNNNNFWTSGTNSSWEHGVPSDNRISAAAVGNKAWVTDLVRNHNQAEESFLNTPCFNLSGLNGDVWVRFYHFRSFNTGSNAVLEYSDNDGATWTKLGSTNSGTNWYNSLSQWSGFSNGWQHSAHLVPTGSIQNLEKVRFRFKFYGHPTFSPNEGFAIDEFEIFELTDDVELVETITPTNSENVGQKTVEVSVANNMSYALSNVPIKYQLDNNTVVSETINSLVANTTATYTFSTNLNMATTGNYVLKVWVDLNSDSYPVNDTSTTNITVQNLVNSFPYYEGFENDNGNWETTGTGTTWEWGVPNNT
ncbi:MAG: CARDB domain-containing protein, partial [Bacteroidia bacterium]